MNRKWQLTFYFIELCWCIWLAFWIWGNLIENPAWYNWAGMVIAVGLLVWWVWTIYRAINPNPKMVNVEVEKDEDGNWWATTNGKTVGPFIHRHEAFERAIEQVQTEMKK